MPNGVHASDDGLDVTAPVSLIEWFVNFYHKLKERGVTPIECIQRKGDLVFVPCGWWHCVLNLEDSIAITQNYVSESNLRLVLDSITVPELVSGIPEERRKGFRDEFIKTLKINRPALYNQEVKAREVTKVGGKRKRSELASAFIASDSFETDKDSTGNNDEEHNQEKGGMFKFSFGSI